ncbi:MAG: response regulator transcription factor [Nitrosomonas sp.]|nr:response regulator transcription factor [Nitrosomonas sp.]
MENKKLKVLLVDDDTEFCDLLAEFLTYEEFQVVSCHDGFSALERLKEENDFRAMVLDITLPRLSGLEILQAIRAKHNIPVIMLTGRGSDIDRIIGLELGADDYLSKPCNLRELAARLRAVLRRSEIHVNWINTSAVSFNLHGIVLESAQRQVKVHDKPLELTSAEFNVLTLLMQSPGHIISKKELTKKVLHRKLTAYDRSIDVHVSRLRQKLAKELQSKNLIKSVRGFGYQMVAEENNNNAA